MLIYTYFAEFFPVLWARELGNSTTFRNELRIKVSHVDRCRRSFLDKNCNYFLWYFELQYAKNWVNVRSTKQISLEKG